eukprot:scaffold6474_cov23-Cyclotella_meneghiniana.AAC.5
MLDGRETKVRGPQTIVDPRLGSVIDYANVFLPFQHVEVVHEGDDGPDVDVPACTDRRHLSPYLNAIFSILWWLLGCSIDRQVLDEIMGLTVTRIQLSRWLPLEKERT